jgi:methionyl-tRNA formyltransferase
MGTPLVEASGVRSGAGWRALLAAEPEVLVVVAYGELLTHEVLALARLGGVNLHFSLLPRWRGAAPVQHAILAGDEVTGVTVMRMDEGLDTGPILGQMEEPIRPGDDAGALGSRLSQLGAGLLTGVLRVLPSGDVPERAQDPALATWAPRLRVADRAVDWSQPADAIVRRVRALAPDPGASTSFRGDTLKVLAAGADPDQLDVVPGAIAEAGGRGVRVAAGSGSVWLLEVAPSGRKRMSAAAWARGARFAEGERLG